jgi:hypothetical protein
MKLRTKLYININDDLTAAPQYEELDMFDFESIELTSSIQEIRDIGSVFTDFSQEFSVPASVNNNRIFTHYYNTNLLNQFDARIKRKGLITINNLTFREGYIRLSEVKLKNNRASSYKLNFFGELVNLKQVLGDDELKDLATALIKYDHEYSIDNVYDGFIDGLGLVAGEMVKSSNRDIVYPSISVSDRWYYKSDPTDLGEKDYKQGKTVNLFTNNDVSLNYGISYLQLKPAIKVKNVIDAIQEVYSDRGIVFSNDFFSDVEFNQLYLLLHSFKGDILNSGGDKFKDYIIGTSDLNSDFEYDGGAGEVRPVKVKYYAGFPVTVTKELYILNLDITTTSPLTGGEYTVELLEGDNVLYSEDLVSSQISSFTIEPEEVNGFEKTYNNLSYKIKTKSLIEFDLYLKMSKIIRVENNLTGGINETAYVSFYDLKDGGQSFLSGGVNVAKFMPKIKIYDFLKGLFNMFNLTAYVDNGLIVVKTLDKFYADGNEIDISSQVDTKDITIKRMNLFSNINFDFSEPKTFGMIKQNEVQQDDYGNLEYEPSTNNLIFDGDRYSIKLPFEKLFFDRLDDENTDTLTDFGNGWLVDKDENETITAPVLFFNRNTTISSSQYFGFKDKTAQLTTYNRPSNSSNNELSTINFNAENDEFTGNLIENSLFKLHYENYIENVFNINSRMHSISAVLNLDTLNNYNMNDRFIINNNKFIINSIRTDLSTGKTELELITDFDLPESSSAPDSTAPSIPTELTLDAINSNSARVFWTESTDNVGVVYYNVYIDNVLYESTFVTGSEIIGLTTATSYDIEVSAVDSNENESDRSSILIITTL